MKNLIDYNQKEIEHRVKCFPFYQIGSYVLFVLLIYFTFLWTVEKDSNEYYKGQIEKRDTVNAHNKIVHQQDSATIYNLSNSGFNYKMEVENE